MQANHITLFEYLVQADKALLRQGSYSWSSSGRLTWRITQHHLPAQSVKHTSQTLANFARSHNTEPALLKSCLVSGCQQQQRCQYILDHRARITPRRIAPGDSGGVQPGRIQMIGTNGTAADKADPAAPQQIRIDLCN